MADQITTSPFDAESITVDSPPTAPPTLASSEPNDNDRLAQILDEAVATFNRHLVLPGGASEAMAVWSANTYVYKIFDHVSVLAIVSGVRGCGKSTLERLLIPLVANPHFTSDISGASMYNVPEGTTLLADEMHTQNARELQNAINSGWSVGGGTTRVIHGKLTRYSTHYPKALAAIGRFPDEIEDRSWVIKLRRKLPTEQRDLLDRTALANAEEIGKRLARAMAAIHPQLVNAAPHIPLQFQNRTADNARPLLAIADAAGGHWPDTIRNALIKLAESTPASVPVGEAILGALRDIIGEGVPGDEFPSQRLVAELEAGSQAGRWDLPTITPKMLARHLSAFDISRPDRLTKERVRGYYRHAFNSAFARYLPPVAEPSSTS